MLGGFPERSRACVYRRVSARVAVRAAVQEPIERFARQAPAQAEARVHLVVEAELVRAAALEVVREAVDVDAELALREAGRREQREER